jgi:alkaline phosphatase D
MPGVVVLGGDLHCAYVADLKADYDDARSAVVASEFCTTSISSNGPPQAWVDEALALNPHVRYGRGDLRGYLALTLDDRQLQARQMAVLRPWDELSPLSVAGSFQVDPRQPGPQRD